MIEDYLQQFVANSQGYNNALLPPEGDNGEHYYSTAREVYKEHKLNTQGIESIWKQRAPK